MHLQLVLAMAAGLLVAPVPKKEAPKDEKALQGMWVVVSAERGGKVSDEIKGDKVTFKDGKITIKGKNKEEKGTYKIDATKKPKSIDLTQEDKTESIQGIYTLQGDTLKICTGSRPGAERPTKFDSKTGMIIVLKRAKK